MLMTLVLFFASLVVIPCLAYKYDRYSLVGWIIVPNVIIILFLTMVLGLSYGKYINMKQDLVNFHTYADAIISYEQFANLNTTETGTIGPLTDLKYQNYQRGIKDLIEDFRNSCIVYNQKLTGKRTLGNNVIFSWLIIMPDDDMKTVRSSDFLNIKNRDLNDV